MAHIDTHTHRLDVSVSLPRPEDVSVTWREDVPDQESLALLDVAPGLTLHLHDDGRDTAYVDELISALTRVRERMPDTPEDA